MRTWSLLLGCLLVAGCSTPESAHVSSADSSTPTTTSATAPEPDEVTTTSSTTTSTTTIPIPTSLVETLDDGRPATFLAVTTDYEAVEVGTETGEVVRSFGTRATAADLELEGEIAPNVVDAVWRTSNGRHILISECCEPAAGRINVLPPDGSLSDSYAESAADAWAALPSPVGSQVVLVGYFTTVVSPSESPGDACESAVFGDCWFGETFLENDGSGIAAIGWNHDGVLVHWYDPGSANLLSWDSATGQLYRAPLTWVDDDQALVGLTGQSSGNVVSFLQSYGTSGEIIGTEGVVYSPETGGLLASFDVPVGSVLGGYDSSGTYLIYTTADGVVEFQGLGRVGQLGSGYFFASW